MFGSFLLVALVLAILVGYGHSTGTSLPKVNVEERNPFLNGMFKKERGELRVHEGTVDEHGRRLGAYGEEPKDQVLVQIHGGNMCDGPTQEQFIISVGLCLVKYNYVKNTSDEHSYFPKQYGYTNPDKMKPVSSMAFDFEEESTILPDGTTKIVKNLVLKMWTTEDGSGSLACDVDGVDEHTSQFYMYLSDDYFDWPYYNNASRPAANTEVESCQSLVAVWDTQVMDRSQYTSVKTTIVNSMVTMGSAVMNDQVGGGFIVKSVGNTCGKAVARADYTRMDTFGECRPISTLSNVHMTGHSVSNYYNPTYDTTANPLLHPGTTTGSYRYLCADDSKMTMQMFSDDKCQDETQTNSYYSTCSMAYTVEGGTGDFYGSSNHRIWGTENNGYKFEDLACRAGSEEIYPRKYEVGSHLVKKEHRWAHAVYYTEDHCRGDIYAMDSNKAGLLHQCLPAQPADKTGFPVRAYTVVCPELCHYENSTEKSCQGQYQGFKKYYWNNLECMGDSIEDYTYPDDAWASRDSNDVNNGSCVATDRETSDRFLDLQAKSYRYMCSGSPPQGLGVTATVYSQSGCKGFPYKAFSFRPELGANWSAPSQEDDSAPNTAPYELHTSCREGKLTNTWKARKPDMVYYDISRNIKRTGCQYDSLENFYSGQDKWGYTGLLLKYFVTDLQCDNDVPPGTAGLSPAAVVGIVFAVLIFAFLGLGTLYWTFMYGPGSHLCTKDDIPGTENPSPEPTRTTTTKQPSYGTRAGSLATTPSGADETGGGFEMGNPLHNDDADV